MLVTPKNSELGLYCLLDSNLMIRMLFLSICKSWKRATNFHHDDEKCVAHFGLVVGSLTSSRLRSPQRMPQEQQALQQRQMRHSDSRITLQKYAHVIGDAQRRAVNALAGRVLELTPGIGAKSVATP
jgi:hypothetical protein